MRSAATALLLIHLSFALSCGSGSVKPDADPTTDTAHDGLRRDADSAVDLRSGFDVVDLLHDSGPSDTSASPDWSVSDQASDLSDLGGIDVIETVEPVDAKPEIGSMVLVPAGNVNIGCNWPDLTECENDQLPYHGLYIDAFYIDVYEVTVGQYWECVGAGTCTIATDVIEHMCKFCYITVPQSSEMPVNCVDWYMAETYCQWAGKRLCSEAEWEKAARCCDGRYFPWGNNLPACEDVGASIGWYQGSGCMYEAALPVGSKPKDISPYGNYDMAGNVTEWVSDWYSGEYYSSSPFDNPQGPTNGELRSARGGSYSHHLWSGITVYIRLVGEPDTMSISKGFRCCKDISI